MLKLVLTNAGVFFHVQTVKNINATVKTDGIFVTKFGRSQAGLMAAAA